MLPGADPNQWCHGTSQVKWCICVCEHIWFPSVPSFSSPLSLGWLFRLTATQCDCFPFRHSTGSPEQPSSRSFILRATSRTHPSPPLSCSLPRSPSAQREMSPCSELPLGWVTVMHTIGGEVAFSQPLFPPCFFGNSPTRVVREHERPCCAILQPQISTQSVFTRNPKPQTEFIPLQKSWIYSPYKKPHTSNF